MLENGKRKCSSYILRCFSKASMKFFSCTLHEFKQVMTSWQSDTAPQVSRNGRIDVTRMIRGEDGYRDAPTFNYKKHNLISFAHTLDYFFRVFALNKLTECYFFLLRSTFLNRKSKTTESF